MSVPNCLGALLLAASLRISSAPRPSPNAFLAMDEDACGSNQCPSDDKTHVVCATITDKFWKDTDQSVSTPQKHNHCICVGATTYYLNKYKVTVEDCKKECPVGKGKINPEEFQFVCSGMGETKDTFLDKDKYTHDPIWMGRNQPTLLATTCITACCPKLYGEESPPKNQSAEPPQKVKSAETPQKTKSAATSFGKSFVLCVASALVAGSVKF